MSHKGIVFETLFYTFELTFTVTIPLEFNIFLVSFLRYLDFFAILSMNSLFDWTIHRNDISSSLVFGLDAICKALTFSGSGKILSFDIMTPQNGILVRIKIHFSRFSACYALVLFSIPCAELQYALPLL